MTKKYILTGGPGSGKSSILLDLESRGEYIVREAAEDVIKLQQARGIQCPWEDSELQRKILNLQLQREGRIPKNIERVFIDRGILDGLAYATPNSEIGKEIQHAAHAYDGVFLIENTGSTKQTGVRHETQEEALELENKLKEIYLAAGYKIRIIPTDKLEERANMILGVIERGILLR